MAYIQDGSSTAGLLAVETASKAARNILYNAAGQPVTRKQLANRDEANDEAFTMGGVHDASYRHIRADAFGGMALALNTSLLTESFEGANFPVSRWTNIGVSWSLAQTAATGLLLNSSSLTTASTGLLIKSLRSFIKMQRAPLHFKARARIAHVANSVAELGLGDATTFNGAKIRNFWCEFVKKPKIYPIPFEIINYLCTQNSKFYP